MDILSQNVQRLENAMDDLARAVSMNRARGEHVGERLQLTRTQIEILSMLGLKSGQTTSELASKLFLTQSAITQTVDTLFRRGLLERCSDDSDRRITRLHLSAAGRQTTDHVRAFKRERLRLLLSRLTADEVDAMITATQKFTTVLEENPHHQ